MRPWLRRPARGAAAIPPLGLEAAIAFDRSAAGSAAAGELTTGALFDMVLALGDPARWRPIVRVIGDPARMGLADEPDAPARRGAPRVREVPLSADLERCVRRLARLMRALAEPAATLDLVAIAVVLEPDAGATRALLRHGGLDHSSLVEIMAETLLGRGIATVW